MSIDNPTAPPRTVILANTLHDADQRELEVDMAYLHAYSAALLEHAAPQLGWTGDDTVEERLVETMTSGARRAVFGAWPSFETLWAQA